MHITDLRQIHDNYDHIYLSPHFDDAVLSCGGAIARHSASGASVLVVTICTATPAPGTVLSQFAQDTHRDWGVAPDEVMSIRRHEDDLALDRLDADSYHGGLLDAIYRMPDAYCDNATLFGTPIANDPLRYAASQLISALHGRAPRATFYAPLGIGNHVDHQIVYNAALDNAGAIIAFYEDFPYVTISGALTRRMQMLGRTFVGSTIDIDATLTRKIGAINAYTSQIVGLFGKTANVAQVVTDYAEDLRPDVGTYGERLWLRAVPM